MKKIIYIIAFTLLLATSCNLEKRPLGSIDSGQAIQSVDDAMNMRNYLYLRLRSLSSGGVINSMELSADSFHASQGFGNRGGTFYKWAWDSSDGTIESLWSAPYDMISNAYFVIEGINNLDKSNLSEADINKLNIYLGESHFTIAYAYYLLVERFCTTYEQGNLANSLGVCLIDKYEPTSDQTKYKARSSMEDTYARIQQHLQEAAKLLANVEGAKGSEYLTKDAVTAFEARVALTMQDWDTAIAKSTSLINSNKYELISNAETYKTMWLKDDGQECIVQMYALKDPASLPNANGGYYIGYNSSNKQYSPDFIPEKWVIDLYDKTNDIRFNAYFQEQVLTFATSQVAEKAFICTKFPGNPDLYAGSSNYVNKVKLFRIAEQYLIAAEAYANKGGNDAASSTILNKLKGKRIENFNEGILLSGDALKAEIKNERIRELFAEGFRLLDIKRYKANLTRSGAQNTKLIFAAGGEETELLSKDASDFRFIFPIPQAEIDANPQISGQQNPGY